MTSAPDRPAIVSERRAMLAGMTPVLKDGVSVFCATADRARAESARPLALGWFEEDEGTTLILSIADAGRLGFDVSLPMARIVLQVFSALDGVGLTAAVATALADADIPCNVVAAYHHDHRFVPAPMADRALAVLKALQEASAS